MSPRPFRFAFLGGGSGAKLIENARKAEAHGYSSFLVPDHFIAPLATGPSLMAVAMATTSLRVGSFVYDNDFRHPALLAREAATIDVLSGGRFELGIGAGWHRGEYEAVGIPFDRWDVRTARLEEAVPLIRKLWGPDPVTHHGTHYHLTDFQGLPRPVQVPLPILIGGGGKRTLSFAAKHADIVGLAPRIAGTGGVDWRSYTIGSTIEQIEWIREAAGDRLADLEINLYFAQALICADRTAGAGELLERMRVRGPVDLSEAEVLEAAQFAVGPVEWVIERMLELRERFGISYFGIGRGGPGDLDAFAPVVAKLADT